MVMITIMGLLLNSLRVSESGSHCHSTRCDVALPTIRNNNNLNSNNSSGNNSNNNGNNNVGNIGIDETTEAEIATPPTPLSLKNKLSSSTTIISSKCTITRKL